MSAEAISIVVTIGGAAYSVDIVGDPDDVMFAVNVGRAVTETLVTHASRARKAADQALAAECVQLEATEWTIPNVRAATCAHCGRSITWKPRPGFVHVGLWRHDAPAMPETRCSGAEPR